MIGGRVGMSGVIVGRTAVGTGVVIGEGSAKGVGITGVGAGAQAARIITARRMNTRHRWNISTSEFKCSGGRALPLPGCAALLAGRLHMGYFNVDTGRDTACRVPTGRYTITLCCLCTGLTPFRGVVQCKQDAPIAQRIERCPPEAEAQVRVLLGASSTQQQRRNAFRRY